LMNGEDTKVAKKKVVTKWCQWRDKSQNV
jgi:hypothetical protein